MESPPDPILGLNPMERSTRDVAEASAPPRPLHLGFAGVGWIGKHRMKALLNSGLVAASAIAEPVAERATAAEKIATGTPRLYQDFEGLLDEDLDGIVIATPSALHASQAIRALEAGIPVFCQKPLGRTATETQQVIEAARRAEKLLGVDFSYRHTEGMQTIRKLLQEGEIGTVYAADLTFHNAYGPDKDWFYDPKASGGGCVIDLGIHLVDLALWALDFPEVNTVTSRLKANGQSISAPREQVEEYATARIDLDGAPSLRLACSWNLPAGQDAVIDVTFYGTKGGLAFRNVDGSFYDFEAVRLDGTDQTVLVEPPDDWGGRTAVAWARQLATSDRYDPAIERVHDVATVVDGIYNRHSLSP